VTNIHEEGRGNAKSDSADPKRRQERLTGQGHSAFTAIRSRSIGPDLVALALLEDPSDMLRRALSRLGQDPDEFARTIEQMILNAGEENLPVGSITRVLDSEVGHAAIFRKIALTPTTFTHRTFISLRVTPEEIVAAFQ
jgi:ClpA/ClpB-like protein